MLGLVTFGQNFLPTGPQATPDIYRIATPVRRMSWSGDHLQTVVNVYEELELTFTTPIRLYSMVLWHMIILSLNPYPTNVENRASS
jgi:hypothetical protein